jgi:hypothetical protein
MGIPVLGPEPMARYARAIGATAAVRSNRGVVLELPQDYADMIGWRRQAEAVAEVWRGLSPAEQATAIVVGTNYGEAGALAMYHHRLGMPYPVSPTGDFHAWGLGGRAGDVAIVLDHADSRAGLERLFWRVDEVGRIEQPLAVPEERDLRIWVAREPRDSLSAIWPTLGPRWN